MLHIALPLVARAGVSVIAPLLSTRNSEALCAHFSKIGLFATLALVRFHVNTVIGDHGQIVLPLAIKSVNTDTELAPY